MLNDLMKKWFSKESSKDEAKKRLQFALVYDRLEVSDDALKEMQQEILSVISRYFVIDTSQFKLNIARTNDDLSTLVFNTPIISAKARKQLSP